VALLAGLFATRVVFNFVGSVFKLALKMVMSLIDALSGGSKLP
jgi:hypothetical protein